MSPIENMNRLTKLAYSLVLLGLVVPVPVHGEPQRDPSRFPPPRGPPPLTFTTTTPAPSVQVVNFPLLPALQLAGGIVGSVLAATRPTEPPPFISAEFSCKGRVPGYYADVSTNCRNFYTCSPRGRRQYHRCGERTIFNQLLLTCDHRRNYDCRLAPQHYSVNEIFKPFRN